MKKNDYFPILRPVITDANDLVDSIMLRPPVECEEQWRKWVAVALLSGEALELEVPPSLAADIQELVHRLRWQPNQPDTPRNWIDAFEWQRLKLKNTNEKLIGDNPEDGRP